VLALAGSGVDGIAVEQINDRDQSQGGIVRVFVFEYVTGGGSIGTEIIASLAAEGDGTRVTYDYAIELTGTVASVGGRLLEGAAKSVVNQFFQRLVAQVGGPEAAVPTETLWSRLLRILGIRK